MNPNAAYLLRYMRSEPELVFSFWQRMNIHPSILTRLIEVDYNELAAAGMLLGGRTRRPVSLRRNIEIDGFRYSLISRAQVVDRSDPRGAQFLKECGL